MARHSKNDPDQTWQRLSLFESHDYILAWYHRRYRRNLNARKTRAVTSCFSQGREYFSSAKRSATSVKPLLLYYGVLSLSRGLILLRDPTKSEENLAQRHGLELVSWQDQLSGGISKILDVQVRATSGTFLELISAAGNSTYADAWRGPPWSDFIYSQDYGEISFASGKVTISLYDLLSRDLHFHSILGETTGRKNRVHLGDVLFTNDGIEINVTPYGDYTNRNLELSETDIVAAFSVKDNAEISWTDSSPRTRLPAYCIKYRVKKLDVARRLPPVTQVDAKGMSFVVEDFPFGDRMTLFLRTYILSYSLGMLVRYFPSVWMSLLRNEKGDAAQPVLIAAVSMIEREFPTLLHETLALP